MIRKPNDMLLEMSQATRTAKVQQSSFHHIQVRMCVCSSSRQRPVLLITSSSSGGWWTQTPPSMLQLETNNASCGDFPSLTIGFDLKEVNKHRRESLIF